MASVDARARIAAVVFAVGLGAVAQPAWGAPQWNASLRAGAANQADRSDLWQRVVFHGSAHGDLILGRRSSQDVGVGPFIDLSTAAFSDLRLTAGPSLLLPISSLCGVFSLGGTLKPTAPSGHGVHGELFLGGRSYNHYGEYSTALGLVLGVDYALDDRHELLMSLAVSMDAQYLALPFMALYSSFQSSD